MMDPTLGTVGAWFDSRRHYEAPVQSPHDDGRRTTSRGGGMSDQTLQAIHDAIAAHVSDLNAGAAEYLTEWVAIGTTAIADNPRGCMYYYIDSRIPRHHAVGLLDHGMNVLNDPGCECDDGDDSDDDDE